MNDKSNRTYTRRNFVKASAAALAATTLGGCCDISPSLATPTFWGYKDYATSDGAPIPVRVFYPSLDGSLQNASFYAGCGSHEYPVIVFTHGSGTTYKSWFEMPAQLARAGNIVVLPEYVPAEEPMNAVPVCQEALNWVLRRGSPYSGAIPPPSE